MARGDMDLTAGQAVRLAEALGRLLDEVQTLADDIRANHTDLIEPLIKRWTGTNREFAKV